MIWEIFLVMLTSSKTYTKLDLSDLAHVPYEDWAILLEMKR